jgi:hypothetical protein
LKKKLTQENLSCAKTEDALSDFPQILANVVVEKPRLKVFLPKTNFQIIFFYQKHMSTFVNLFMASKKPKKSFQTPKSTQN